MVPQILDTLEFRSNNDTPSGDFSSRVAQSTKVTQHYYSNDQIFINGVLKSGWRDLIVEIDKDGKSGSTASTTKLVFSSFEGQAALKEIWVVGAKRYCNGRR